MYVYISYSDDCELIIALICIFLLTSNVEWLLIGLFTFRVSSLYKYLLKSFAHF